MKKIFIVTITCISFVGLQVNAQNKKAIPPPPPPAPPVAQVQDMVPPPPPPLPPVVSEPAPPPQPPVIINEQGAEVSVISRKNVPTVVVVKDGKTTYIRMSTWNTNRKAYEKKYGNLPAPPPPPPVPGIPPPPPPPPISFPAPAAPQNVQ